MDFFYVIVLTIAVILLILILTSVGLLMKNGKSSSVFPPNANSCPDGWSVTTITGVSGEVCQIPESAEPSSYTSGAVPAGTYNSSNSTLNFDPSLWGGFGGKTAKCSQTYWANSNNISWDGVSNFNAC